MMNPKHNKKRLFKSKQALHIVFSAKVCLFNNSRARQIVDSLIIKYARYFGVKVYHRAVMANHIHMALLPNTEEGLHNFLRVFSAQVSVKFRMKKILSKGFKNIWKARPWSRVLTWRRNYTIAIRYIALNYLESTDAIKRTKKKGEMAFFSALIDKVLDEKLTVPALAV